MQRCIFSIITAVFSVTWSSGISLISWWCAGVGGVWSVLCVCRSRWRSWWEASVWRSVKKPSWASAVQSGSSVPSTTNWRPKFTSPACRIAREPRQTGQWSNTQSVCFKCNEDLQNFTNQNYFFIVILLIFVLYFYYYTYFYIIFCIIATVFSWHFVTSNNQLHFNNELIN